MLVYANHLTVQGDKCGEIFHRVVGIWLKEQLGFGLHPDKLKEDGNFQGKRGSWLQIRVAKTEEPKYFSWVLKQVDESVGGRQWIVELGLKTEMDQTELSCVVRTDDQSTLITESHPVSASQPRLIRYAVRDILRSETCRFSLGVPGLEVKSIGGDSDSYRAFLASIERGIIYLTPIISAATLRRFQPKSAQYAAKLEKPHPLPWRQSGLPARHELGVGGPNRH